MFDGLEHGLLKKQPVLYIKSRLKSKTTMFDYLEGLDAFRFLF